VAPSQKESGRRLCDSRIVNSKKKKKTHKNKKKKKNLKSEFDAEERLPRRTKLKTLWWGNPEKGAASVAEVGERGAGG